MDDREKEIQLLCTKVLEFGTEDTGDYGTGTECSLCFAMADYYQQPMKDIKHESDCPYLIAKGLSTGFK